MSSPALAQRTAKGKGALRVWELVYLALAEEKRPLTAREIAERIGRWREVSRQTVGAALSRRRDVVFCRQPGYHWSLLEWDEPVPGLAKSPHVRAQAAVPVSPAERPASSGPVTRRANGAYRESQLSRGTLMMAVSTALISLFALAIMAIAMFRVMTRK